VKVPLEVFVEELSSPSIKQLGEITLGHLAPDIQVLLISSSWIQGFIDYIKENKLPEDKEEATRII
jgi:hypothetical protein